MKHFPWDSNCVPLKDLTQFKTTSRPPFETPPKTQPTFCPLLQACEAGGFHGLLLQNLSEAPETWLAVANLGGGFRHLLLRWYKYFKRFWCGLLFFSLIDFVVFFCFFLICLMVFADRICFWINALAALAATELRSSKWMTCSTLWNRLYQWAFSTLSFWAVEFAIHYQSHVLLAQHTLGKYIGQAADRHALAACCMQHGLRKQVSGDNNRAEPFF